MPTPKKPTKQICELVNLQNYAHLQFTEKSKKKSLWRERFNSLRQHPDHGIKFLAADIYSLMMLRNEARKQGCKIATAIDKEYIICKVIELPGDLKRLILLLRERRSKAFLESQKLELNLNRELEILIQKEYLNLSKGEYQLTSLGLKELLNARI